MFPSYSNQSVDLLTGFYMMGALIVKRLALEYNFYIYCTNVRGVFRTQSNNYAGTFSENS